MDIEEICDALPAFKRTEVRHQVRQMLASGKLQLNFGYYTPSALGLQIYESVKNPPVRPTDTQHKILSLFADHGAMNAAQLSVRSARTRRMANIMIANLVKAAWLTRDGDVCSLTPAGHEALFVDEDSQEKPWRLPNTDDIVRQALATQTTFVFNLGKQ